MTHTVFIDLDSHVATASATGTAAPDVPLKHLTKQTLAFAFHSSGTVSAVTGWSTGRVVIKATPTSDVLLLDTTLAATGSTTSTRYSAEWAAVDCDSAALRTLIGASVEQLDVFAEIQWTADSGTHAVAFPIQIVPTFNLPEDAPPDPTEEASWTWLKARLAAGSNITFTDNDTTQVRTIASSGGGGGGGGSTNWGDIGGTLSDQTDLQTALNNKQPLAAALTTLSSATAAGLALMDDADAAAQRTTLGLGNVDNTSDASKPVSTAQQTALNGKANTSHTHAQADVSGLVSALAAKAALTQIVRADTTQTLAASAKLQHAWNAGTLAWLRMPFGALGAGDSDSNYLDDFPVNFLAGLIYISVPFSDKQPSNRYVTIELVTNDGTSDSTVASLEIQLDNNTMTNGALISGWDGVVLSKELIKSIRASMGLYAGDPFANLTVWVGGVWG